MHKRILDTPRTNKPRKDVKTSSLIVRPTRSGASERLLANNGTGALIIVIDVARSMAKAGGCVQESVTVR